MAVVAIAGIKSLGKVDDFQFIPDDRQKQVEVMDGTVVQDFGHNSQGDKMSFQAVFRIADFDRVYAIWENRTLVDFQDVAGRKWEGCRILIKTWQYVGNIEKKAVKASFEIWRV